MEGFVENPSFFKHSKRFVIEKGAVVGGGSDVTDDLIAKMGKASDDQIKEAENAAKAQEQQDAQQNAQQAGQTTAVNTEESAQ